MGVIIGLIAMPAALAVGLWLFAGRERARLGTGRLLHICSAVVLLFVASSGIAVASGIRDVARVMSSHGSERAITADVTWYDHAAVIDLVGVPRRDRPSVPQPSADPSDFRDTAHATRVTAQARVPQPAARELVMWSMLQILTPLAAMIVAALLLVVLDAARKGDPFGPRSARTIAAIGYFLLIAVPGLVGVESILSDVVSMNPAHEWIGSRPSSTPTALLLPWVPGCAVLALAAIFRHGNALRDLDRLTV